MRNAILCAAAAFSLLVAPGMATAGVTEPVARIVPPMTSVDGNAPLIFVAGGCGAGFHRGPRGVCRRNYYGHPVYRRHVRRHRECVRRWTHYGWRTVCRYY
jgi:hypothetical protein